METRLMVLVLVTALMGNSHQLSVCIENVERHMPCPPNHDCFPRYYKVCVDLLKDNSSCNVILHSCKDNLHCENMKMENETFPQLYLPHQNVTDESFIQVYIAESLTLDTECSPPSASDCRSLNTSYQFRNVNFSFQVTLQGVPLTLSTVSTTRHTNEVPTPVHTDPTTSLLSSEVSSASHASIGASLSALTSPMIHQEPMTARPTGNTLTSTRGIPSSRPSSTEPPSDKGPLLGEIIGGVLAAVIIVIVIAVIIICCCWKRPRVTPEKKEKTSPPGTDVEMYRAEGKQGLPETSEQGVITSQPPTSNQVEITEEKEDKKYKLPPLNLDTSNVDLEKKKKKKKRKKKSKEMDKQLKGESYIIEQEQEQAVLITSNETLSRKERKKKKKEKRDRKKSMVTSGVEQGRDNTDVITDTAAKEERRRERKEKRKKKRSDNPTATDEQTKEEGAFSMPAPMHNANDEQTRGKETFDMSASTHNANDEQTNDEETFYILAPTHNANDKQTSDKQAFDMSAPTLNAYDEQANDEETFYILAPTHNVIYERNADVETTYTDNQDYVYTNQPLVSQNNSTPDRRRRKKRKLRQEPGNETKEHISIDD